MTKRPVDPVSVAQTPGGVSRASPAPAPEGGPAACGDLDMRIGRDGTWFYHGSPIGRKPLVKLFALVLTRDEDGVYWLVTPVEKGRVEVDDAPFVAVALTASGSGRLQSLGFRTNLDDEVTADADHPIRAARDPESGEMRPYVLVRGRLEALIARSVFYELVELGVEDEVGGEPIFGVWSEGCFFPLGRIRETR